MEKNLAFFCYGLDNAALDAIFLYCIKRLRFVESINPIILDGLKEYLDDSPNIPREMQDLVERLLRVETHSSISREGIDKIYEQILEKFVDNGNLVEWCKNNVSR